MLSKNKNQKTKILVEGEDIINFIPQKAPVVMVDMLYECSTEKAVAGLNVRNDNMFCEDGLFRETGVIEHIAQSAALMAGYQQHAGNTPPSIGYIGSVKNFVLYFLPSAGNRLITTVTVLHVVGNVKILSGKVECNAKTVATCEMKVVY